MAAIYSTELYILNSTNVRPVLDGKVLGGFVKPSITHAAVATADLDLNDNIIMARLPSDAIIHSLRVFNTDMDTNGSPTLTVDLGVFAGQDFTTSTGTKYTKGQIIDVDCLGEDYAILQSANRNGTELRFQQLGLNTSGRTLGYLAGFGATDLHVQLDIGFTVSAAAATVAAGDIVLQIMYTA